MDPFITKKGGAQRRAFRVSITITAGVQVAVIVVIIIIITLARRTSDTCLFTHVKMTRKNIYGVEANGSDHSGGKHHARVREVIANVLLCTLLYFVRGVL